MKIVGQSYTVNGEYVHYFGKLGIYNLFLLEKTDATNVIYFAEDKDGEYQVVGEVIAQASADSNFTYVHLTLKEEK